MKNKNKNKQATASEIADFEREINNDLQILMAPVKPAFKVKIVGEAIHVHYGRFLWKLPDALCDMEKKQQMSGEVVKNLVRLNFAISDTKLWSSEYRFLVGLVICSVIGHAGSTQHPFNVAFMANRLVYEFYKFMNGRTGDETEFNRDGKVTYDAHRQLVRWLTKRVISSAA